MHKIAIKWNSCQEIYLESTLYDIKQKVKLCGLSFFFVQHWNKSNGPAIQLLFVTVAIEDPVERSKMFVIHVGHVSYQVSTPEEGSVEPKIQEINCNVYLI